MKCDMVIQAEEINIIQSRLEYGDKKKLAEYLEVHQVTLSRWLQYDSKVDGWRMPREAYRRIIDYINQL